MKRPLPRFRARGYPVNTVMNQIVAYCRAAFGPGRQETRVGRSLRHLFRWRTP